MAYPTVSKPYGLQAGQFDRRAGLCRRYSLNRRIASGYAHGNLVFGDLVIRVNGRYCCPFCS
jgi:hypothetical protein